MGRCLDRPPMVRITEGTLQAGTRTRRERDLCRSRWRLQHQLEQSAPDYSLRQAATASPKTHRYRPFDGCKCAARVGGCRTHAARIAHGIPGTVEAGKYVSRYAPVIDPSW